MLSAAEPEGRRPRSTVICSDEWVRTVVHDVFNCDERTAEKLMLRTQLLDHT